MEDKDLLEKFNKSKEAKTMAIAYGGDGELLNIASCIGTKKGIIPIRNYGLCEKHKGILDDVVEKKSFKHGLKYSRIHTSCSLMN